MAGDWIKMRVDLQNHPKVRRMATALRTDKFRTIGALHAVWSLFDTHSIDGVLDGYTSAELDAEIVLEGMSAAMEMVGWIEVGDDVLSLPRFDEHNGQSAKRRATDSQRKRTGRKTDAKRPPRVRKTSVTHADEVRTREEKRREEKKEEALVPASPTLPADGDEATEIIQRAAAVLAPQMQLIDDITASQWLRDISPDPWWIVAAMCDAASQQGGRGLATARTPSYLTPILRERGNDGWQSPGPEFAKHVLATIQRQRGAA
jgi:hypothetical protein